MTQIVSTGTSGMGRKPQSMRVPTHPGREQPFRASGFMDSGGISLEFTSCCYFLILYFSYLQVFFLIFTF